MIDLKCKCTNCCFNRNSNCKAKHISVDKGTTCCSYLSRRNRDSEFADEISQPLVRPSTDVECHADCMFEREGVCIANGITVTEENSNATCSTFLPK